VATLGVAGAIIAGAALSFLGLGAVPPTPEWGLMLSSGRNYLRAAPWITTFPGLAIMVTVLAINLLGDGLRDALDPHMKR
jgi:peptide/nickel transport system permease protein